MELPLVGQYLHHAWGGRGNNLYVVVEHYPQEVAYLVYPILSNTEHTMYKLPTTDFVITDHKPAIPITYGGIDYLVETETSTLIALQAIPTACKLNANHPIYKYAQMALLIL